MEKRKMRIHFIGGLLSLMLFLNGCETDDPAVIFNPELQVTGAPSISTVSPEGSAFANISEITITGENFSSQDSGNVVYFNGLKATVLSSSSTEIRVAPVDLVAESVKIQVVVNGAITIAEFANYRLENLSVEYGDFGILDQVFAIAMDADENLYAQNKDRIIYKVTPEGAKTEFGTVDFAKATDMRMGPGGNLYLQRSNNVNLYRIGPEGGAATVFAELPGRGSFLDLDANGNIFVSARRTGLFVVNPDASTREVGDYADHDVKAIKVFDGNVYVAGNYLGANAAFPSAGVWKSRITSNTGDVASTELVYDWTTSGDFAGSRILAMAISQDGELLIGTNNADPILVVQPDGSSAALYEGVLGPFAIQLLWGNGNFLYFNRGGAVETRRVLRIGMPKAGAPYYGRQ